jgi:hypothetical protein
MFKKKKIWGGHTWPFEGGSAFGHSYGTKGVAETTSKPPLGTLGVAEPPPSG